MSTGETEQPAPNNGFGRSSKRLKRNCSLGDHSPARKGSQSVSPTVFGARIGGRGWQLFLAAAAIHLGRDRATPTTPVEIDGAAQVWHLLGHYAQFRAPAFPSSLPCRSRCRALAGLVRAQTSDDIRPRALCTPPPKSFTRSPRTVHPANAATGITVWSASFAPGVHFGADSDLCATAYIAGAAGPHSMRRATAGWIPCDFESEIDVAGH